MHHDEVKRMVLLNLLAALRFSIHVGDKTCQIRLNAPHLQYTECESVWINTKGPASYIFLRNPHSLICLGLSVFMLIIFPRHKFDSKHNTYNWMIKMNVDF